MKTPMLFILLCLLSGNMLAQRSSPREVSILIEKRGSDSLRIRLNEPFGLVDFFKKIIVTKKEDTLCIKAIRYSYFSMLLPHFRKVNNIIRIDGGIYHINTYGGLWEKQLHNGKWDFYPVPQALKALGIHPTEKP